MRDYFKTKTWAISALMLVTAFGLSFTMVYYEFGLQQNIKISNASSGDNVSGYAWNEKSGWISFNCTNDGSCGSSNYGVSIDPNTGDFSGYAWSAGAGWISFNEIGAPDYSFNANCATAGNCSASNNCTACYNFSDHKVYGWAKILALGNNGWIKLRKSPGDSGGDYGVSINSSIDFSGWAWNADDASNSGLGWISFNCVSDTCAMVNYKVTGNVNRAPTVASLTAPNWSFSDASQYGALNAKLGWTFSDQDVGATESAYEVIVNNVNSTANPIFDSGKCTGAAPPDDPSKCPVYIGVPFPLGSVHKSNPGPADFLEYDTPYYWWVRVWDNLDATSSLAQYNTVPDTQNNDGQPLTFTTYKHEFPLVSATFFPANPSQGEMVKFTDTSKVYSNAAPTIATACDPSKCAWLWIAPGNMINDAASSTPTITFNTAGPNSVTLQVTDQEGYSSQTTMNLNVSNKLPNWKEVKPE